MRKFLSWGVLCIVMLFLPELARGQTNTPTNTPTATATPTPTPGPALTISSSTATQLVEVGSRTVTLYGKLTMAGTYKTGGGVLSFVGVPLNQTSRGQSMKPRAVFIHGQAGFIYEYDEGTGRDDGKVLIRVATSTGTNTAFAEHSQVSLVSGVTGDTITLMAVFDR